MRMSDENVALGPAPPMTNDPAVGPGSTLTERLTMTKSWYCCVVLSCALLSVGCAPVLVGGAAAGGYYVGKDDRSVGEITDDASITTAVNAKYVKDDLVKARDINVDTHQGVVTLHGTVASAKVAERAVQLARAVKGVRQVVSKLRVVSGAPGR
jgi:hyperosmotically inducible periplasmic protein